MEKEIERKKRVFNTGVWIALIIATIGVCVLLIRYWRYLRQFQILIYLGLFFTAVLAGSPIPIPTPCMALTFTLGSKFEPVVIGLIASSGAAIGSMLVYFTARTGRHFLPSLNISDPANKIYSSPAGKFLQKIKLPRVVEFVNRRGNVGVFLFSIFPNPLLMPLLVTMGISRVRVWKVTISCWLGHSVLFLVLAFLGHYGLASLLRYFGVFKLP
ncbi:MAG: VTT domain-containing protein [Dehalococcoidales bacterium]|nr:VTT domain-containing protein [Dehalococcoidales bacterium]